MGNKIPLIFPVVMAGGAAVPWYLAGGVAAANCLAAYKAVGAADIATSYVNLANPGTYDCTAPVAAPTFNTVTGWTFDGASQYLDTGITKANVATWSILIKFDGVAGATGYIAGYWRDTAFGFILSPNRTNVRRYYNGSTVLAKSAASASGVIGIAGDTAYIDGASDGAITAAASTGGIFLGADKGDAGVHSYCACRIQAVAIYDTVLSLAQVEAVTAAMLPFDTTYVSPEITIAFMPDMQTLTSTYPDVLAAQANWIVANQGTYNIRVVLTAGDLTEISAEAEWNLVDAMYDIFDAANLPYLPTIGNHDGVVARGNCPDFNTYFPQARMTSKSWWSGGFYEAGQSQNSYLILGNYLFITLEHVPRQVVLDWAATIVAANPTKKVVFITHALENFDGSFSTDGDDYDGNSYFVGDIHDGDLIWDDLCKLYDNFVLLLSGHFLGGQLAHHVATGDLGNKVSSQFINYQTGAAADKGYFRLVSFYNSGTLLWVRTYAPDVGWLTSADAQYFVDLS